MSETDVFKKMEKEIRVLKKKLERSETSRSTLEKMWDRNSHLFQTLNHEIEQQRELIEQQHQKLEEEQKKSESLLHNILPVSIAERLKNNPSVIADSFKNTTILFSDIVGFTEFSEAIPPDELVNLLNHVFSIFDRLAEKHRLEKIKTIGDAYMVAGGIPAPRQDHADAVIKMAIEMQEGLTQFNLENNQTFDIRIGIHTGTVVAGVIGIKKFIYDVWGDTVNTASRMESHGIPGKIQVSEATYDLLKSKYEFKERGVIEIKGKGQMKAYLLQGKKDNPN